MISIYIPGLSVQSYDRTRGDAQVIYDSKKNAIIIDAGQSELSTQLFAFCRKTGITHATYILTHWHGDHDAGMEAILNSSIIVDRIYCPPPEEVKKLVKDDGVTEYNRATRRLNLAKSLGKVFVYPPADSVTKIKVGEIECHIWRRSAHTSDFFEYQVNNTSMQTYFPQLYYLSTGDIINAFTTYLKTKPGPITVFKIPHHGNACTTDPCKLLKQAGAKLCWYNHIEKSGVGIGNDSFSKWGAGYTKNYFTTLRADEPITMVADNGVLTVTKGNSKYRFSVPYYSGSWVEDDKGVRYKKDDGTYYKDGPYQISTKWYYFDKDGYRITGWYKASDGKYRYLNPQMYISSWVSENYYVDDYGRRIENGPYKVGEKWYYFDEKGVVRKGWFKPDKYDRYLEPAMVVNAVKTIDGKSYSFDGYGRATEIKMEQKATPEVNNKNRLNVIDIASYQSGLDLTKMPAAGLDGVIIKATQGTSYVNPYCNKHYGQAKQAGLLRGLYHYANGSGAIKEADYFVNSIKNYIGDAILVLDWEGEQNSQFGKNDVAYCKMFLDRVYEKTGVRPLIYMSKSVCRAHDWSSVAKNYGLWAAQYANNNETGWQSNPWTDGASFGAWSFAAIYQYSSHGKLKGYDGRLDLDLAYMTAEAWNKYANPGKK